jgi:hypothetical protein
VSSGYQARIKWVSGEDRVGIIGYQVGIKGSSGYQGVSSGYQRVPHRDQVDTIPWPAQIQRFRGVKWGSNRDDMGIEWSRRPGPRRMQRVCTGTVVHPEQAFRGGQGREGDAASVYRIQEHLYTSSKQSGYRVPPCLLGAVRADEGVDLGALDVVHTLHGILDLLLVTPAPGGGAGESREVSSRKLRWT